MATNPLLKYLSSKKKEEEYSNPYDTGEIWSAPSTPISTPSTSQFLNYSDSSNPLLNALVASQDLTGGIDDPLSAPRNQMNYYSKQLETLGQEVEAPQTTFQKTLNGALDILNKFTSVGRSVENAFAGTAKGAIDTTKKAQPFVEQTEAYRKLQEKGYTTDSTGKIYDMKTGEEITPNVNDSLVDGLLGKNKAKNSLSAKEKGELMKLGIQASQEADALMKKQGVDNNPFKNMAKGAKEGFVNTYKNAFGDLSYDEVSDFGNIMKYQRTGDDTVSQAMQKQTDNGGLATALRAMGVNDESARAWQEGLTDVGMSMMAGQFLDINDAGKTIKYLNKSDELKDINKITSNMDLAKKVTNNNISYGMFADSMKASAKANNITDLSEEAIKTAYKNFKEANAGKLLKDTEKVLGGLGDFTGLKLGNRTIITTETLDKIASNKVAKMLTEVGLSAYSPAGALLNGSITNKIGKAIEGTEIGSKASESLQKAFGGKSSQFKTTAKKVFKEEGSEGAETIMKNINMVDSNSMYKRFKELQDKHTFSNYKKFMDSGEDLEQVTKAMEGKKRTILAPEEKDVINDNYVSKVKDFLQQELLDEKSNLAKVISESDDETLKALSKEIAELENIPKATSINFKKELSKIGMSEHEKYFKEAITMSPEDLAKHLEAEGVQDATGVANRIKTVANGLMDNIEKNNPNLLQYLKGVEDFDLNKVFAHYNYNYDPNDIKSITKEINDIKAKNKTYTELHGSSSEYFENKIAKLEIEKDRLKAKKKIDKREAKIKAKKEAEIKAKKEAETKEVKPEEKDKKLTVDELVKLYEKEIEGVELDTVKGADEVTEGTVRANKEFEGFKIPAGDNTTRRRELTIQKLKDMDIEVSDLDKAYINGLSEYELKNYEKVVVAKQTFDSTNKTLLGKGSLEMLEQDIAEFEELGMKVPVDIKKKYKALSDTRNYFEKQGVEIPTNFTDALEKIAMDRVAGKKTPIYKFGKLAKEGDGIPSKMQNLVTTTKITNTMSDEDISKLAKQITRERGENVWGRELEKVYHAYLNFTKYGKNIMESDKILREYGVYISPLNRKELKHEDIKELVNKVVNGNREKKYVDMLKNMTDDEIAIFKRGMTHKKVLPNDMQYRDILMKEAGKTDWSKDANYVGQSIYEDYDMGTEIAMRDEWLAESMERQVKREYDGTQFEKVVTNRKKKNISNEIPDDVKEILNREYDKLEEVRNLDLPKPKLEEPKVEPKVEKPKVEKSKLEKLKTEKTKIEPKTEKAKVDTPKKAPKMPKVKGLTFEIEGKKVVVDENTSYKDLQKIVDNGFIAEENVFTNKIKQYGATSGNGEYVAVNPSKHKTREQLVDTMTHENTHVVQLREDLNSIGGAELKEQLDKLPDADVEKVGKLIEAIERQGTARTTEKFIRKKVLTGYIGTVLKDYKGDKLRYVRETDATVASLLLNADPQVAKLSREVFGDDLADKYFRKLCDMGEEDFDKMVPDMSYLNREIPVEALKQRLISLREVGNELLSNDKTKEIKDLLANLNKDNLQVVDDMVNRIKNLNPKKYHEALGQIPTHIKMIDYIEKTVTEDLTGTLNKEQMKIYNEVRDYFVRFGKEEGIIKDGYEDLYSNYVFHMLNPDIKMNERAYRLAKEEFGESIESVFNANKLNRKYKGTIGEINESFKKKLAEAGEDEINLFETNIANIYLKRSLNNSDTLYREQKAKMFLDNFALKDHGQFSKEANTVDRFEGVLKELGVKENISELSKQFKESGQTIYQFLKENADKNGITIYDDELIEYGTKRYAQSVLSERFGLAGEISALEKNGVVYDMEINKLINVPELNDKYYEGKIKVINEMKAKGLTNNDYIDHRKLATKEGKKLVTNADVNVEVYNSAPMQELRKRKVIAEKRLEEVIKTSGYKTKAYEIVKKDLDEAKANYKKAGQKARRELRDKYKSDNNIHFAYSDVELNEQKAYRSMMDHMVAQDDYVKVTKINPKQYEQYITVKNPENMTRAIDKDNILEINADELRKINVTEDNLDVYYIKKQDWENYKVMRDEIKYKDKNVFLDMYDKALNVFKTMSLGTGRFVTNSAFGNFFESYMTAGVNLMNPKMVKKYIDFKAGKDIKIGKYSATEMKHMMEVFGVNETQAVNDMVQSDIYKKIKNITEPTQSPLQKLGKKIAPVNPLSEDFVLYKDIIRGAQVGIEEFSRFINMATHLEKGQDFATAIKWTNEALFDYSDLSKFERETVKRIIPFYTFMRNNIPLQIKNAGNNVGKTKQLLNIYSELNGMQTDKENALRPDYLDEAVYIGNGKFLNLPNPINDLNKLLHPTEMFSSITPALKVPVELATNTQLYSGTEVTKYDDNGERVKYAIDSSFPLFKTYGNALSKAKEGDYKALANVLGVPIKDFDIDKAEQQTMYEYVDKLENQYYKFLEDNPEAKEYLKEQKKAKKNSSKQSVLNKLLK